ncbi:MAG: UDP-N-acetylmuramoyl-L-alanine--D-glutamate ligase [Oscillospiraceae bacterium]|nr:UDP-N-acetylmuramoyl-L-alanine--D-glutamate ligase [Oscillospiraceae bacterium]
MKLSEYIDSIKDKKIAVVGIGVSNIPLIERLLDSGCGVIACDKSDRAALGETAERLERLGAKLFLGADYLKHLDGADIIFRTPGIRPDLPEFEAARERGCEITSEMEVFFKVCPCRIIAITGSDGKTTTTTIIAELLKAEGFTVHLGGNIGKPLLCEADDMKASDIAVLELSSFQLMTMKSSPDIAVVTNLAPNHLDVHRDMGEYVAAKKNIFLHQSENGRVILNLDNAITASFAPEARGEVCYFSRKSAVTDGFYCMGGVIYDAHDGELDDVMNASEIFIPGDHNIENFLAAFAAVRGLVSRETMRSIAVTFDGVEHRIEFVRELDGVKYYNDSIASSPSRTIAGLKAFKQKVILIAGGKDKGVPFDELGAEILMRAKALVLTGLTAEKIKTAVLNAPNYRDGYPIIVKDDFRGAVLAASEMASEGDIVLLSPACTSFDKFKNFAERGKLFKEIVNSL